MVKFYCTVLLVITVSGLILQIKVLVFGNSKINFYNDKFSGICSNALQHAHQNTTVLHSGLTRIKRFASWEQKTTCRLLNWHQLTLSPSILTQIMLILQVTYFPCWIWCTLVVTTHTSLTVIFIFF